MTDVALDERRRPLRTVVAAALAALVVVLATAGAVAPTLFGQGFLLDRDRSDGPSVWNRTFGAALSDRPTWIVATATLALLPLAYVAWRRTTHPRGRVIGATASVVAAVGITLLLLPARRVDHWGSYAWWWPACALAFGAAFLVAPPARR